MLLKSTSASIKIISFKKKSYQWTAECGGEMNYTGLPTKNKQTSSNAEPCPKCVASQSKLRLWCAKNLAKIETSMSGLFWDFPIGGRWPDVLVRHRDDKVRMSESKCSNPRPQLWLYDTVDRMDVCVVTHKSQG